ncbi:hypothetical protein Vretimale_15928 [Volvox reticuliferus]|uniref:Uncharacterized protein n=1 Tax=Volvox reticuliferus TaxID=1737510 RepID=A0A8J4GPY6_9CHLO|nr:hypothetical protein Vretifemale_12988 [Volvox reticuliferus]GIM12584.1 hypothetical protein Vretimale_15928 [Volvox reticuliferus]
MSGFGLAAEIDDGALPAPENNFGRQGSDTGFVAEASLGGGIPPVQRRGAAQSDLGLAPKLPLSRRNAGGDNFGLEAETAGKHTTPDEPDPVFMAPDARKGGSVPPGTTDTVARPPRRVGPSGGKGRLVPRSDPDAGQVKDNMRRPQQMPPSAMYPSDDLGFPATSPSGAAEDPADLFARTKAQKLLSRQTASRVAQKELDRQADVMTRRPPTQQERQRAASTIQRYYRGYRVRKSLPPNASIFRRGKAALPAASAAPGVRGEHFGLTPDQQMMGKVRFDPGTNFEPRRALPTVPIIDIDKMPKYGILSQPLPRAERRAGTFIEYNRDTHTFVKNRDALREGLEYKRGYLEQRPLVQWAEFTSRQKHRYAPIPPDANRRALPETQGYRLRILKVSDMPINTTFDGRTFEFQLGVSLYDEAYGTFYGNTCYSMADTYDRGRAAQRNAIDLDLSFDVYYHTTVSDPRCMAVVEVIMLERMLDGVVKGQYSLGWALLPLFRVSQNPLPPGAPVVSSMQLDDVPGRPMAARLMAGTPRYLMFRNVYNEDLRPPKVIPDATILFQAEVYPAMEPYIPLLPENFLVTYSDTVPGLRRFAASGLLSTTTKTVISTLASPMLSPTYSVMLRRLQLALPMRVHDLLMSLDARHGMATGYAPPPGTAAAQSPIYQTPTTGSLTYTIRVSVHNGRTFVGPAYELIDLTHLDVPGWKVLQVPTPHPVFDYVMADALVAIVVELLATPPQAPPPPGLAPLQYLIGYTAFVPFSDIREDGSAAHVAVGVHRYQLKPPEPLVLRDQPQLNWRAMLGDMLSMEIPEPLVEFQLFETARTPILPPLKKVFAVIEAQREEEAELGDQPLEQLLQPVPVPEEIVPPPEINEVDPNARVPSPPPVGEMVPLERVPSVDLMQSRRSYGSPRDYTMPPELTELTAAMQRQLELLTRAVDELKDERKSLRNSFLSLTDRQGRDDVNPRDNAAAAVQRYYDAQRDRRGNLQPSPEELQRFLDMEPTRNFGDQAMFSGAQAPDGKLPGSAPSRVLLQQLHDAGMLDALPADVQAILRRRGPPRGPSAMPYDLAIEARDPRVASDIVVQFLAYRHHDTLNAPANLKSLYLTFQFYHFPPTTSEVGFLVPIRLEDDAVDSTSVIVPSDPAKKGAGLVLKFEVDGGTEPVPSGQTAQQAGFEAAMAFAQYLAHKTLHLDVWDGESLLQLGTASVDLQPLLRQGRDFSELLVEVPILDQAAVAPSLQGQTFAEAAYNANTGQNDTKATVISKGSIVLRILNLGRDSRNADAKLPEFDDAHNRPNKKRVRAKPAWEIPQSPIARELAAMGAGMPASPTGRLQGNAAEASAVIGAYGGPGAIPFGGPAPVGLAPPGEEMKLRILENSHRKSARVQQYLRLEDADVGPGRQGLRESGYSGREDQFRRVQKQLLADVSAARSRRKHDFILEQLRKSMVTRRVVRPAYGEVLVYEHEFQNPYGHEQTFEVRISKPTDVSILSRMDDYRALRAANARFLGTVSQPVGPLEQEIMSGNRIYLQAHERITLPFRLQSFEPPDAYKSTAVSPPEPPVNQSLAARVRSSAAAAGRGSPVRPAAGGITAAAVPAALPSGHTVSIEMISTKDDVPVSVLELDVVPRPIIIDRTFRYYQPERQLLRTTVKLRNLPGAQASYFAAAAGALRHVCAACSNPDVILGVGSSGLTAGPDRDELYLKYKVGGAPEVAHFYVLLYLDRLMARPVEVWQVFVHALRKVDMRAMIGQTSQASVVVRGVISRRVAAYNTHPDELQVSPDSFVLVGGALTELLISFRPVAVGIKDIKINIVDSETRELVYAMLVTAEAQGPLITRTFEVELPVGTVANKKITYTNPYQHYRIFTLRSNQPWLVHFTPPRLQMPAGATRPVGITFDARAATAGIVDALVFVNDDEDKTEECLKIRVRIYK